MKTYIVPLAGLSKSRSRGIEGSRVCHSTDSTPPSGRMASHILDRPLRSLRLPTRPRVVLQPPTVSNYVFVYGAFCLRLEVHTQNETMASGTAFAISYHASTSLFR